MASKLDKQIGIVMKEYNDAFQKVMAADGKSDIAKDRQRLDDLDALRKQLSKKRGESGDIMVLTIQDIASDDSERAARLRKVLNLKVKSPKVEEKFNPHHVPAGSPEGGQFAEAPEGVSTSRKIAGTLHTLTIHKDNWDVASSETLIAEVKLEGGEVVEYHMTQDAKEIMDRRFEGRDEAIRTVIGGIEDVVAESREEDLAKVKTVGIATGESGELLRFGRIDARWAGVYVQKGTAGFDIKDDMIEINAEVKFLDNVDTQTSIAKTYKHETGHAAWANLSTDQRVRYAELVDHPNPEIFRSGGTGYEFPKSSDEAILRDNALHERVKATTRYGNRNIIESFAETYREVDWSSGGTSSDFGKVLDAGSRLPVSESQQISDDALREIAQW